MSTIEKTGQTVAISFYKLLNRLNNSPENVKHSIQQASRVLICLPADVQDRDAALQIFSVWKSCFPHAEIFGLLSVIGTDEPGTLNKSINIVHKNDISILGLPGKRIKSLLTENPVNIAIDLNRKYDTLSTLLILMSNAKIRAGYYHEYRTRLYNFLVRVSPETSPQHAIQALLTYFKLK